VKDVSSLKEEISSVSTTTVYIKITVQCTHEAEIESKDN